MDEIDEIHDRPRVVKQHRVNPFNVNVAPAIALEILARALELDHLHHVLAVVVNDHMRFWREPTVGDDNEFVVNFHQLFKKQFAVDKVTVHGLEILL